MHNAKNPEKSIRRRLWRAMYDAGWTKSEMDDTLRSRIARALYEWHRWYAWGRPVMWLVGRYDSGSAGPPRGRDMWWIPEEYVEGLSASLVADFERRNGCYVTHRYADVSATAGDIDWRIYDLQDEGHTVKVGLWPCRPEHGGRIQPLPWQELNVPLFLHWYLMEHKIKAQWFGLRSWLYWRALHSSLHDKRPFACQVTPEPGTGGYSHWHCQLRKRHRGEHRFRNYTWTAEAHVAFQPEDVA